MPTRHPKQVPDQPVPAPEFMPPPGAMDPVPPVASGSARPQWTKRRPPLVAAATVAALALLGAGILAGRTLTPTGPSSLTTAIMAAAAGHFPCGPTQTLPGALKTVCGVKSTPAGSGGGNTIHRARLRRGRGRGISPVIAIFGRGATAGRIVAVGPSLIRIRSPHGPIAFAIGQATQALTIQRSGPTLTENPEPLSGLVAGEFAVVVPTAPAGSGGALTAAYIFTRPAAPSTAP